VAVVSAYPNGLTAGMPGRGVFSDSRGAIAGWTQGSVRRHTRWLYAQDIDGLSGFGWSFTFTLAENPASQVEWKRALDALCARWTRRGALRIHWLCEMTRRKRIHLHGVVYFPSDDRNHGPRMERDWLDLAADQWGSGHQGQRARRVEGVRGWLAYISKHSARGVNHYQRQGRPDGWTSMGRVWGYRGSWPTTVPLRFVVSRAGFFWLRRQSRAYALSDARSRLVAARRRGDVSASRAARRSIRSLRHQLAVGDRAKSEVRGISEWVPESVSLTLLLALMDRGEASPEGASADAGQRPALADPVVVTL
jgi:hypothetical protein